ncbi:MAG: 50S ribosomal protein L22 [Candidatus Niyogibacteria bacterium]|nr:50S ribosomal protein L22 [Candidatus Niyogibacteria bacterium]
MEIKAQLNNLRIAPRKVRLVAGLVRGITVAEAKHRLTALNKHASGPVAKLLLSAVANAKNNLKLDGDDNMLVVKEIRVDQGPAIKRFRPRAFGRAAMIKKKMSHVSVRLEAKNSIKTKKKIAK